jgi:hypothetical protein
MTHSWSVQQATAARKTAQEAEGHVSAAAASQVLEENCKKGHTMNLDNINSGLIKWQVMGDVRTCCVSRTKWVGDVPC